MKITLLHPSRGRHIKARHTLEKWLSRASGEHEIEHLLSVDSSDQWHQYANVFQGLQHTKLIVNDNTCVVEATNHAAKKATGDILIYLSDDFDCPHHWDKLIVQRTQGVPVFMLRVNDGLQPMENCVLTIPIMSRTLYEQLGYFWHPEYKSMWVDCDLYFTTKPYMIEAPELLFQHEHPAIGKAEMDETYRRSEKNWNQGVEVFNRRSRENGWGRAFKKVPAR